MENEQKQLIIITGCDSGMGRCIAEILYRRGYAILASYLEEDPRQDKKDFYSMKMDLRDDGDIDSFAAYALSLINNGCKLFALVNNAGIAAGGPVENLSMEVFRQVMQINFFGLVALTRKFIPALIQSKGKIIIHGSMAGKIALPFLAPYAASKFALEGFTDSLRRELNPLGIKTVLLNTAGVATPIWNKAKRMKPEDFNPRYHKSLETFIENFVDAGNRGLDQNIASERICNIIEKINPRPRYIIAESRLLSRIELLIPDGLFDRIIRRLFKMEYPDK